MGLTFESEVYHDGGLVAANGSFREEEIRDVKRRGIAFENVACETILKAKKLNATDPALPA